MINSNKDKKNRNGFTIIELMVATVIFSIILVICLSGMVQVSRAYYKGITHSKTQEAARNLMDEITETIQLSGSAISIDDPSAGVTGPEITNLDDGVGAFCAGNKKYTYAIDRKVVNGASNEANKEIKNALISTEESCTDSLTANSADLNADINPSAANRPRSLLSENMRLTKFEITPVTPHANASLKEGGQLWRVELSIAYGDQDLISYTDDNGANRVICAPGTGDEFCSIVEISTIVARRIG